MLFLGSKPQTTPALYSLMNYADSALGTWYPMGGMHGIVDAMVSVAKDQGVKFHSGQAVEGIIELRWKNSRHSSGRHKPLKQTM